MVKSFMEDHNMVAANGITAFLEKKIVTLTPIVPNIAWKQLTE